MVGYISGIVGTSSRLLRLLSLLQTPRDWTGSELAERLEVSPRTIRNDIERLRALGYPVHATRGAIGGYRLGAGTTLPPLLLDDDEAVALVVGLRTAAGGALTGIEETSLRALAKLEQVLPARLRSRVNALHTHTILVGPRPGPRVDPDVLTVLAGTCRDHHLLRFDYEDRRGGASLRRVEPHRLVNMGSRWYLVAWDPDRTDWRTFRVDRIRPHLPTGPRFAAHELSDRQVTDLVSRAIPAAARRHRARVVVHAPAATIAERIGPWVGTVEALDADTCILDTGADSLPILAVHLGMLEVDFTVTEPPELVEHLRGLAGRYGRATPMPVVDRPRRARSASIDRRLPMRDGAMSNAGSDERLSDVVDRLQGEVAELRSSRRRLAEAADADRREIERALHDGVQQYLVALAVDLRRLAGLVDGDPAAVRSLLDEMATNVREALDETARLAERVYPPLLEARGLASALRSAAVSVGVTALIDVPAGASYPPDITAAIYRSCIEALSSASPGSHATVTVIDADGGLTFDIGVVGHHPEGRLDHLRDRIEALDGRISVEDRQDGGSRVHGWLPLSR